MTKLDKILSYSEKFSQSYGVTLTEKRTKVLAILLNANKAISAYELIEDYKAKFCQAIPITSIYRILGYLESVHLVHKLNIVNKYAARAQMGYDSENRFTQLLFCKQCQKVNELAISQSTILEVKKSAENLGFHLISPQLELSCTCAACKN